MSPPRPRDVTSPSSVPLMHEDKESADSEIWSTDDVYAPSKVSRVQRARYVFKVFWTQYQKRRPNNPLFPQVVHSRVLDLLEDELRKFHLGFEPDLTEYQGQPSPELDELGVTHVPVEEARKLPIKTTLFPHHEEKGYLMKLDVFHQLHCLNMIRQALSPEYYNGSLPGPDSEDELLGFHHINHCVDAIRQSLLCSVVVSVLTCHWDETKQMIAERGTILHTCRNFDKIESWAWEQAITHTFDMNYRVLNDSLDDMTWNDGYRGD